MRQKIKRYGHLRMGYRIAVALGGLLLFLAMALTAAAAAERNYREKMEILYAMAAGTEQGMDSLTLAAGILKGTELPDMEQVRERLHSLGYLESYKSIYRESYIRDCMGGAVMCLAGWLVCLAGMLVSERVCAARREKELESVRGYIGRLRGGSLATAAAQWEDLEESLQMELESLAEGLAVMRSQAASEKEETKALVTDISHQLKTPVAALKACFEIGRSSGLTDREREEFFLRSSGQIDRLEELVAALVNISRMETGMITIHREEAAIFDTVALAVNRVYPDVLAGKLEIEVEADEELENLELPHDARWISEALLNVLDNAVKYSFAGSRIVVRLVKMPMFLRIEIEDEGIGIPKEEWNQIFRRFYRGSSAAVREKSGSGVGLYLARQILERHHGTLTVAPPAGGRQGSRFVFQLPYR